MDAYGTGCPGCQHDRGDAGCALLNLPGCSPAYDTIWQWCNEKMEEDRQAQTPCPGREPIDLEVF